MASSAAYGVLRGTRAIAVDVDHARGVFVLRRGLFGGSALTLPMSAVSHLAVERGSTPAGLPWDLSRRIGSGRLVFSLVDGTVVPLSKEFSAPLVAHEDALQELVAAFVATPLDP
jgi:hypothetical protein